MSNPDVILAVVAYLQAQSDLTTEMDTIQAGSSANIWDFEIPPNFAVDMAMPQPGVIIRPHGGSKDPGPVELNYSRFQLIAYGPTAHLAYVVYYTAHFALKRISATPSVWAGTYIHNVLQQSGPVYGRDSALTWPSHTALYEAKASDLGV